jgi:hypothetical protein
MSMRVVGRRILYLRTLDLDREQFWALLLPFLDRVPTDEETKAWYEYGDLPAKFKVMAENAREEELSKEQFPRRLMDRIRQKG